MEQTFSDALPILTFLVGCQFHVTLAETFNEAKIQMTRRAPTLLITEVRLGEYNGLGLVLRGKVREPNMAAVVTSTIEDRVLQADAEAMGATFLLKPFEAREFQAATLRTLFAAGSGGSTEPIRPPYERRAVERRDNAGPGDEERRHVERRRDLPILIAATVTRRTARPR